MIKGNDISYNITEMDLNSLTKTELLAKCEELGIKKCKSKNKNELIDDIYDNKCIILLEKYDDLKNILNDQTIKVFEHFKNKYDTDDMKENVINRIELVLYNNRNLIRK